MRAFLVAFVLALSVVAAGCGGSKSSETTPTEKWASGLCTSVNTWKSSITSTVSFVRQSGVSRDSLQKGVDQAKTATNKLTDDLRGLGRPNTEAGKEAQSQVDQFANELDDNIKKVEDAVGNTSGTQSALSALSVIGSTVSAMSQQLKSTITSLEGLGQGRKEIQQAFQTVPACKDLTASLT